MALGTRELYLILRARDEASRVLRGVGSNIRNLDRDAQAAAQRQIQHGQALASVGIAIGTAGVVGLNAINKMVDAAAAYNTQAAYTKTQTDNVGISLKQLEKVGLDVAKAIPVPFEDIQSTMYDIFSSMD